MLKVKAWVSTNRFCSFRSPQCVIRLRLSIQLVGGTIENLSLRILLKSLSSAFSADASRSCGKGLSLITSCSKADIKPRVCPSLIWSSIRLISRQITRITLFGYSLSQIFFCLIAVENSWKIKLHVLLKPVAITTKTSLYSSKQFTAIFCSY